MLPPSETCEPPPPPPLHTETHHVLFPLQTQFLYETYPDIVNPIEGVLNEHFIVWMRTAGLPRFRKVYGRIDEGIQPQSLTFNIIASENPCSGSRRPVG